MRCKAIQGLTADRAKIKQANFQDDGAIVELIDEGGGLFTLVYCFPDEPDAINAAPALAVPSINPDIPATPPAAPLDSPAPTPTGSAEAFVAARRIGPTTVLYTDAKGRGVLREGGSRAWRNNNPGNIRKGDFAVSAGAIGDDGSFAIFPDARTGMEVIVALLRSPSYRSLTLEDAIFRYAPPVENNSDKYIAFVEKETGISRDVVVGSLPAKMLSAVAKAIRGMEGWTEGKERPDMPLSGTALAASGAPVGVTSAAGASEEWMGIAAAEAALPARDRSAWADPEENPRILNYFKVAASQSLKVWQRKGWIYADDPRGWFQWYCRYYMGRRLPDEDARQIKRWKAISRHIAQLRKNCQLGDLNCRPVQRQAILHWAYDSRLL